MKKNSNLFIILIVSLFIIIAIGAIIISVTHQRDSSFVINDTLESQEWSKDGANTDSSNQKNNQEESDLSQSAETDINWDSDQITDVTQNQNLSTVSEINDVETNKGNDTEDGEFKEVTLQEGESGEDIIINELPIDWE